MKKNDKRIALMKVVLKDHTESSSSSSSSEKKRRSVTKELTVSRAPNDVQVMYYKISFRTKLPKFTMPWMRGYVQRKGVSRDVCVYMCCYSSLTGDLPRAVSPTG